jgi:hypothetical protein
MGAIRTGRPGVGSRRYQLQQYSGSGLVSPWSRVAGGCLSSCTVDSEESEAYSEEEDSEHSERCEEFEWT